jgi:hypothetical protein
MSKLLLALSILLAFESGARAQTSQVIFNTSTGNYFAPGQVWMYLNPSGLAVSSSAANPAPVTWNLSLLDAG